MGGLEAALPLIHLLFEKMMQSKFLRGDNKRGWKASFDWLFENDKNWVKVYEGNYDSHPEQQYNNTPSNDTIPQDRYTKRRGADSAARSAEDYTDTI